MFKPGQTVTLGNAPADAHSFRFTLVRIDNSRAEPGKNAWVLLDPSGNETGAVPEALLQKDQSQ
jgi:hypothetical protein